MSSYAFCVAVMLLPTSDARSQDTTPEPITNSIGQQLRFVSAGGYIRGGKPIGEGGFFKDHVEYDAADETPRHPVRLTKPFYLSATEVTVAQFRQFVAATNHKTSAEKSGKGIVGFEPHEPEADRRAKFGFRQKPEFTWKSVGFPQQDNHPVVGVSWQDAQAFCGWLSKKEGVRYRLPTEAEWEYACRAGTDTYFSWGDSYKQIHQLANVGNTELERAHPDRVLIQWIVDTANGPADPHVYTAPVGSYSANPWGINDLHGNVWEWCEDKYIDTAYASFKRPRYDAPIPRAIDPFNDKSALDEGDWRVIRGGSWFTSPLHSRAATRAYYESSEAAAYIGFRVARDPSAEELAVAKQAFDAEEQARKTVLQVVGKFESQQGTDIRVRFSRNATRDVTGLLAKIGGMRDVHLHDVKDGGMLADIAAVPHLRAFHLHVAENFTDDHFAPLAQCKQLETLHISAVPDITGGAIQHIAGLTNLERLSLSIDLVTDAQLGQLRGLTKLRELEIHGTKSNGSALAELSRSPLTLLSVRGLTDETAQHLRNFPNLTQLSVYDSQMMDSGFEAIASLRRLKNLHMQNCPNISSGAFAALSNMHSLERLNMQGTHFGDAGLAGLSNMDLVALQVDSDAVTDVGMRHICKMITLKDLTLGPKTRVTDIGLRHLWRLNRLERLYMSAPKITGSGFSTLTELPNLSSLRLTSPALTDRALEFLSETPKLNHIELGWGATKNSPHLTDAGLQVMAEKPNWRQININIKGTAITAAGIVQFKTTLKNTRIEVRQ